MFEVGMHEVSLGPTLLVNAEVDSMGGVLDGGVGIDTKESPRRAAIEKAYSELRQEYDVRNERRRELEFLEKGGNPLDLKLGQAASVSVQSTSQTYQHPEQNVTSAAKSNFPSTASPRWDSIESSERPTTIFDPTSADNLLLFDVDNELVDDGRYSTRHSKRNNIASSEKSSHTEGYQNTKDSEDLANFRPYARRNRSRSNREDARSNSTDTILPHGGHFSSLPAGLSCKDTKGQLLDSNNQMDQSKSSLVNRKYTTINGDPGAVGACSGNCSEVDLNGLQESSAVVAKVGMHEGALDVTSSMDMKEKEQNQLLNVDALLPTVDMDKMIPSNTISRREGLVSVSFNCSTPCATTKIDNVKSSGQLNKTGSLQRKRDNNQDELQISGVLKTKNVDSESSCAQTSLSLVRNNESDLCDNTGNADNNVTHKDEMLGSEEKGDLVGETLVKEDNGTNHANSGFITNDDYDSVDQNHKGHGSIVKKETHSIGPCLQNGSNVSCKMAGLETTDSTGSDIDRKPDNNSEPDREFLSIIRHQETMGSSICELADASSSGMDPADAPDIQTHNRLKLINKAHEDSILEEAKTIEAKRKRITELSAHALPLEQCRNSHWDFVLEEMAWLANDVAQERLWKMAAASTISHQVALTSQSRFEEQKLCREQKKVAFTLTKAVMHFWHSIQELVNNDNPIEASKELEPRSEENRTRVIGYGKRFLKYTKTIVSTQSEAPLTPDRMSNSGIQDLLDANEFMEESLVYLAPFGAFETYRKTVESCLIQLKKTGSIVMQEEVDTSMYGTVEDLSQGNTYDEDGGETSMYYYPGGIEGGKPSKFSLKKQKKFTSAYNDRSYEPGADFPYEQCTIGSHQSILIRKRRATNLNVGFIPTKRVRTASRPRVQSPFGAGPTGSLPAQNKTDASSGDTNSFPDDQSILHSDGPQLHKGLEAESAAVDFEKPLPYDSGEISAKPKKKKKAKHLNSTYEPGWQLDSIIHNEQRDNLKKRLECRHLDSNGSSGSLGQHNAKKPKMMKQSLDNTFYNGSPRTGSIPSPVASQMSNMSNTNKFMKLIGGRDRGRKSKSMKISVSQPGSGNPWSLFEDQALVVLVHDMGPNWELVSDAINSTLQFKCIYRKPKECKERHKNLMDRTAGDGADSAEDSGSSQPYPSTLPGIPKGSARQLFQRLQGPMEEDTLKSHFEKIISIGHKQHYLKSQTDNQEMKHISSIHDSHVLSLSQICPNNLNGGFLTPLDLCDMSGSSPDVIAHGYQGPQSSGLAITNQGFVTPFSTSSANLSLQGSGGNIPSPSSAINASIRDVRYVSPRTSLSVDEQQRLQQYNPMISGRSVQQLNFPVSGALSGMDHRARMVPGGNGMGVIGGKNRTMPPISRPGFQGIASASMQNNGSMLSSSTVGMPSHGTMHHGASSGLGNSMPRPLEAMHIMRPAQNQEHQRQLMLPQHQMQVSQGNSQGVTHLNGLNSHFSNQTVSPVTTYPIHSSQQHQVSTLQLHVLQNSPYPPVQGPNQNTGTRHPAYAQLKERQLQQQRLMQQRHQQYHLNVSSALTPQVQPQFQPPVSPSSQQVSHPSSTPSPPMTPMSLQLQQKQNPLPHGIGRSPQISVGGLNNQMGKQRQIQAQKQPFQQTGMQHPQQRLEPHSQQQVKLLKGMGRGNLSVNQNLSIDPSQSNGISTATVGRAGEKGEQVRHLMQGQGIYSGSVQNSVQLPCSDMSLQSSNHSQFQQKLSSATAPPLSKQFHQMPSYSDNSSQGHTLSASSGSQGLDSHQATRPSVTTPNHHRRQIHLQQPNKQINQAQTSNQRLLHQNRQGSSDFPSDSTTSQPHADQRLVDNTSHSETITSVLQYGIDSTNVTPAVYSSNATPRKATEPVSSMQSPASPLDSLGGSLPRSNSMQPINLIQRQFSGGFEPHGHKEHVEPQQELPQLLGQPHQSKQQMPSA